MNSTEGDIHFSVVIPSYNESVNIRKCLEALRANDAGGYEVVVVDNGSSDGTVETARELGIRVLENETGRRRHIGTLRNLGARLTRGRLIAFLDADMVVPPDWLAKAKAYFDGGFEGALGFTESAPEQAGWVGRTWGSRYYQGLDRVVEVDFLNGRNLFVNRSLFEKLGGFDETLVTNEDKEMTMRIARAGYRLLSVPERALFHLGYEKDLREFVVKEFWRQGSSLAAARQAGLSLRNLRAPLLSFWHISLMTAIALSLLLGRPYPALALLTAWIGPSAVITFKKLSPDASWIFRASFFFLTLLRWNVAGAALLTQLFRLFMPKRAPEGGV